MRLRDVASYALGNLNRHKLRTSLTCAGVAVGVSTLTVMVSLGTGLEKMVTDQFSADEFTTRITVMRLGEGSNPFEMKKTEAKGDPITDAVIARLDALPGVLVAYPDTSSRLTVDTGDQATSSGIYGLPMRAIGAPYQRALLAGRYWTSEDAGLVCVLPSRVAQKLGIHKPEQAVGKKIAVCGWLSLGRYREIVEEEPDPNNPTGPPLKTTRYERPQGLVVTELDVIGVYDSDKYGLLGLLLHVPLSTGLELKADYPLPFNLGLEEGEYRTALVKVKTPTEIDAVRKRIEAEGFATQTVLDMLGWLRWIFLFFQVALSIFGGIGLVVSFFGIANTMVMAVMERVREIGVLKALGARNRDIRRIFFVEAATIGLAGGALGVFFGWLVGEALNAIIRSLIPADADIASLQLFYVPLWLVAFGLGVSTLVAMVAGIYPAWRAARLDPVEALRRD